MKWPSDKLPKIAQPKAKITAVLSDSGQCSVALAELESEDAQSLLKSIKELGYTAAADVSDKDGYMYMGTASDGSSLTFTYNIADKEGLVIYVTAAASGNLPGGVTLPDITQSLPNVPGY
jgi:hypothetical protein